MTALSMPAPVSVTLRRTNCPGRRSEWAGMLGGVKPGLVRREWSIARRCSWRRAR